MKHLVLRAAAILALGLTAAKAEALACNIDQIDYAGLRMETQDCETGDVVVSYLDTRQGWKPRGPENVSGQFQVQRVRSVRLPQFSDYPANTYSGRTHKPDLTSDPDANAYRTRLRNAARGPVNFAGEYILATWGCGTTCLMGAVISARTGKVNFLPHTVCCWDVDRDNPIDYRADSNLIIFTGLLDEEEPGATHYYEFSRGQFRFLYKQAVSGRQDPVRTSRVRTPSSARPMASSGADTDVTDFTLVNDLQHNITINWLDGQAREVWSEGGAQTGTRPWVSPGESWRVERGAKTWESHWFAVVSQQGFVCSFSPRQGETVQLSQLQACNKASLSNRPRNKPLPTGKSAQCYTTDDGHYDCTFKGTDRNGSFEISAPGKPTFNLFIDTPGMASGSANYGTGRGVSLPGMYIRQKDDPACWRNDVTNAEICAW